MARSGRLNWWEWEKSIQRMHERARNTPPDYRREDWVTVPEAMRMLGLSRTTVEQRMKEGRLNYIQFHPREPRLIWREDVEWEKRRADKETGRQGDKETAVDRLPTVGGGLEAVPLEHGHWIGTGVAMAMLGVSKSMVRYLVAQGRLNPRREGARGRWKYDAVEVERLANERLESGPGPQYGKNLRAWGSRSQLMDTWSTGPFDAEQVEWIEAREAAEILGVGRERVYDIADAGLLPVYQREPGKRGSQLLFPRSMVERLRDRPERLARRASWEKGQQTTDDGRPTTGGPMSAGWEEKGIASVDMREPSASTDKSRGSLLTTRQAALLLGVHPSIVHLQRKRGRLHGLHVKPQNPNSNGYRWWFYRREDVEQLMADPVYIEHRRRYKKALREKAERIRAANDPAEIARQAQACLDAMRRDLSSAEWWQMNLQG